jgi:LysM repeat protein
VLAWAAVNHRLLPTQFLRRVSRRAAFGFIVWELLVSATAVAGDESYIVKRGDTIYGIARSYGISPAVLADRNGLSRNYYVYAGQRLMIPGRPATRASASKASRASARTAAPRLPRSVQQAIDHARVRPGRWQYIVIHHSGVDAGTVRSMDRYHRNVRHMENGLAYHFVVGNGSGMGDGEIAMTLRWTQQLDGGHLASEAQDKVALGICLVGNFQQNKPSARQLESLRALVEALMVRCRLAPSAVKTHQQINVVHTRCPGAKFPTSNFLGSLKPPAARR